MTEKYTVAIIGCGRLGQHYAEVYQTLPNTEVIAIAEYNPERRKAVGERFGISALYQDAEALFRHQNPDIAAVVLPGKFIKEAVIAAAQAGVKGVSTDKPIEARLSDVDAMVEECEKRGVLFAGGNLQRAMGEVQEAARWLRTGDYGTLRGASMHGWRGGYRAAAASTSRCCGCLPTPKSPKSSPGAIRRRHWKVQRIPASSSMANSSSAMDCRARYSARPATARASRCGATTR